MLSAMPSLNKNPYLIGKCNESILFFFHQAMLTFEHQKENTNSNLHTAEAMAFDTNKSQF